jgi:hypothetical protein
LVIFTDFGLNTYTSIVFSYRSFGRCSSVAAEETNVPCLLWYQLNETTIGGQALSKYLSRSTAAFGTVSISDLMKYPLMIGDKISV